MIIIISSKLFDLALIVDKIFADSKLNRILYYISLPALSERKTKLKTTQCTHT
eukprot:Pgem_evm1s13892